MSEVVTLSLRVTLDGPVEAECIVPDRFVSLAEREIASLPVWCGARAARLGDFFDVRGERSARVRVIGSVMLLHALGASTAGGELVIDGDAGGGIGAGMTGGTIEVRGSVGDDAGLAMSGGTLRVNGSAGDRLGGASPGASRGMTGGEIIVTGSAGAEAAMRARRGLVVVGGDTGALGARAMIAGTLVVFGRAGPGTGVSSKRGTIIAVGGVEVPVTYRYACTYRPPHLRLTMTYLQQRHNLAIDQRAVGGRYRRYCGDAGDPGRGEILELVAE